MPVSERPPTEIDRILAKEGYSQLLTRLEVANVLGVSVSTVHRIRAQLPHPVRIGARANVRWRRIDIATYIAAL